MGDNLVYTSGAYVNKDIADGDGARRFETSFLYLKDIVILVKTKAQLFGDSSNQTYPVGAGESIGLSGIDISTLYFKNTASGEHGTVHILGVRR